MGACLSACCTSCCKGCKFCCCKVCKQLFKGKLSVTLHWMVLISAFVALCSACFAWGATAHHMSMLSQCDSPECNANRLLVVEASLGSFAIHFFLIVVCIAVGVAEKACKCIARYLGFLAFRSGRGMSLIVCGLVSFSYSRAYVKALEPYAAPPESSLVCTVIGIFTAVCGTVVLSCALAPCSKLPPDPLALEFKDIHVMWRNSRRTGDSNGSCTRESRNSAAADVEMGGQGDSSKREKSSSKSKSKSKAGGAGASAGTACAGGYPSAVSASQGSGAATTVCDNPFLTGNDNPFMKKEASAAGHV